MQTLLSRFCEEFVRLLHPMLPPLGRTADAIAGAPADAPGKALQAQLADLRRQMQLLAEKVTEQRSYVLIFGPLKSGKSTLMNGIARAYVSEVSSLPAYPCMVFVSHAPERSYTLTHYSGKSDTFSGPDELKRRVERAHGDLAAKIREVERTGHTFDPAAHFDEAISRIDVRVPTGELGQSRAVLVDTPGLYSRMKFGYDRMTRDFRSVAACAIFVVRSDNLFLEQVFAEFTDLLDLFSRIFLVVNIDSAKQDLGPDGALTPSLEQRDPARIIDAFEKLAMSTPLREAADQGRLRIYPVDLLHSARQRMAGQASRGNGHGAGNVEAAATATAPAAHNAEFDRFFADLTSYLDSSEYLVAFLGDSLRRATMLIGDAEKLCSHAEVESLRARIAALEQEEREQEDRRHALERLEGAAWTKRLDKLAEKLATACESVAMEMGDTLGDAVASAGKRWFATSQSLGELCKSDLRRLFTEYQEELTAAVSKELSDLLVQSGVGIELSEPLLKALDRVEIDLVAISRKAHRETDREGLIAVPPTPLRSEHFAVRRSLWDWILLRGRAARQRRLFGPADNPALSIRPEVKRARLGDAGLAEVRRRMDAYQHAFVADTEERVVAGFARSYCRIVLDQLTKTLRARRADADGELVRVRDQMAQQRQMLAPIDELQRAARTALASLAKLSEHYGQVDLFLLTKPVELEQRRAPAPATAPAGREQAPVAEPSAKKAVMIPRPAASPTGVPAPPTAAESAMPPATPNHTIKPQDGASRAPKPPPLR